MRKSAGVGLTLVAAMAASLQAREPRPDPCAAATFNEEACRMAVQNRGYCRNGRWVRMKYRQPFPSYYDAYTEFIEEGGSANAMEVGACGPSGLFDIRHHGGYAARGGFGRSAGCHGAHG
jgi:hypothetical protein